MRRDRRALALGVFSLVLGATQLLAPRRLGRAVGVGEHPVLMRVLGAREIATGALVLARPDQPAPLWLRVAGDVLDLALLTRAVVFRRSKGRIGAAIGAVAGVTALDVAAASLRHRI